jgi:hypothetical protein
MRRLLVEAGEDLESLMKLCRADITSKNPEKVKRYLRNFDLVEKRLVELEEKDKLRNFQPVITGEIIMETFNIKPSKVIGALKETIREAILEGIITNEYGIAHTYMLEEGRKLGLEPVPNQKEKL